MRRYIALATALLTLAACSQQAYEDTPVSLPPPPAEAPPPSATAGGPPLPAGQTEGWDLVFSDEFEGATLDRQRWDDHSTAEPDMGRGNPGNQQLEWNQAANCQVRENALVMTARRQAVNAASGTRYAWTSCLITSTPSYKFQYGYIEERSVLPSAKGFWPAFWTWQARGVDKHTETDVYEFYSDNHGRLYGTQFSGARARCDIKPEFDPTGDWHTYGVAIEPTGTTWYIDGMQVCSSPATSDGETNIISNLAVYSKIPPDAGTTVASKHVDYIRAWQRPGAGNP
ncbi:glycoside hydrolase family 16 protein [Actinoplanes sp. NPDC051470]|uniref:glycoside hydrolase family 16 protein n=1 Tax=unclassified Actinoplanes TaxID=2626549 RepID=UPI003442A518